MAMTLGSLFDGSGGFPLAGLLSGIVPKWASEIEPFPIAVTKKRLPMMKHIGDVSKINGAEIEPVDIITFGSPCQDMSIAGKRSGLDGSRSSLFYQAIRIIKEMRDATNGKYPRFAVWENVPGCLSSNSGDDFRKVLEEFCRIKDESVSVPMPAKWTKAGSIMADDFSIGWRLLDAQHFGVAQRRRRMFVVADFGGQCGFKILSESEGLSGYSPQSFHAWKRAAEGIENCPGETGTICMCDQGGERIDVLTDKTSTLRAEAHHPPCIMESAGFCTEHSAKARGIGYENEKSPTLRAGVVPAAIALENHPADSRVNISENNICQTLTSRCGTGGGNVPLLMEEVPITLKIRSGCIGGGKGPLWQNDKSATLSCNNDQTLFVPTAFGICSKHSNSMLSDNPNSGFYEADTSRTIDTSNQSPCKNQGGMVVVEGNGSRPSHHGDGYKEAETMYTLNTTENHGVAYGIGRPAFNQGYNALYSFQIEEETAPTMVAKGPGAVAAPVYSTSKASYHTLPEEEIANTLVASDYKDPPTAAHSFYPQMKAESQCFSTEVANTLVNGTNPGHHNGVLQLTDVDYIVRRLTPSECAKLQGFPSWWCKGLENPEPTEADIDEWEQIFEIFRQAVSPDTKPKTRKAIEKFLKNPHSDSAEYRLWGNGISLPVVWFVLAGIRYYTELGANCERTDIL